MTENRRLLIRNLSRGTVVAGTAALAESSAERRTGLLKRERFEPGDGLLIAPCEAVHSFFMKFPIDVLYLDREHVVRKARPHLAPWRISGCLTAHSVLELPAGQIERTGTQQGDRLQFQWITDEENPGFVERRQG